MRASDWLQGHGNSFIVTDSVLPVHLSTYSCITAQRSSFGLKESTCCQKEVGQLLLEETASSWVTERRELFCEVLPLSVKTRNTSTENLTIKSFTKKLHSYILCQEESINAQLYEKHRQTWHENKLYSTGSQVFLSLRCKRKFSKTANHNAKLSSMECNEVCISETSCGKYVNWVNTRLNRYTSDTVFVV